MGASISRLQRAGGNSQAAIAGLEGEIAGGKLNLADPQYAGYQDPATRQAWLDSKIHETTKGKGSGILGKALKLIAIPAQALGGPVLGLGLRAAGELARTGSVKKIQLGRQAGHTALQQAAMAAAAGAGAAAPAVAGVGAGTGSAGTGILAGAKGLIGKVGSAISKNPLKAAQIGLAGLSAVQGAKRQGQADTLLQGATNRVLTPTPRVDLGSMFADPGNPYAPGRAVLPNRAAAAARAALGG